MKKILLITISALLTIPTFAQYEEPGFYRVKNKGAANRYITIVNDRVYKAFKSIGVSELYQFMAVNALRTVKDPVTDPGSIIYISGESGDLSLEGQGMKTRNLLKGYHLVSTGSALCSEYQGQMIYLMDNFEIGEEKNATVGVGVNKVRGNAGTYASWEIKKIDNDQEYLGVKPDITVGDKYYTTLYTSFAYQLPEGMKAYYIDEHQYSNIAEPAAVLKEIGGKVPAATPVILECSSNKVEDNKLKPLSSAEAPAAISGNELKGIYFCYVKFSFDDRSRGESTVENMVEEKNVTDYNESTMRVLGSVDGKLALVVAKDNQLEVTNKGKYLLANKAYFPIKATEASATKGGIKLVDKASFDNLTAINSATYDQAPSANGVYTLTGVRMKADNSTEGLPSGIYIINGKKVIVK